MSRLVDADAYKKEMKCAWPDDWEYVLDDMPTIEADTVRHGKWIMVDHLWQCDKCHTRQNEKTPTNYCPNCGAKMDKE